MSQEGNVGHSNFIAGGKRLGVEDRLEVRPDYYSFAAGSGECFVVTLCLNVLHHLGDDFGDQSLSLTEAKQQISLALNRLARTTRHLWMQLGFNWKGDRHRPLFASGTKSELIDYVRHNVQGHWHIDNIAVVNPKTRVYEPINDFNLQRFDTLGEFLNRPLFLLTSMYD